MNTSRLHYHEMQLQKPRKAGHSRRIKKKKPYHVDGTLDRNAHEYITDVVNICIRDAGMKIEESTTDDDSNDEWKQAVDYVKDCIEEDSQWAIEEGLVTEEEWDGLTRQSEDQMLEEIALRLIEKIVKFNMKMSDYWVRHGEDFDEEEEEDGFGYFEYWAILRELLEELRAALSAGDSENVVKAVDSLFDEVGEESEDIAVVEHWANLLIQPFLTRDPTGLRLEEVARLVSTYVKELAERLCELIAKDRIALRFIEWRQLEEVIATALERIGFSVVLTPPSKDGGKDVIASCWLRGKKHTFFVEIKHWRSGKRVDEVPVLDFVEINVKASDGGLFLSTSGYTKDVFSHVAELECANVRLGGANKIISLCKHYTRQGHGLWTGNVLPQILFENTIPRIHDYFDKNSS